MRERLFCVEREEPIWEEKETQGDRLVKGRRLAEQSATVGWERGTW